jgi:excinuclease UvrABC helicase subunit UvrB
VGARAHSYRFDHIYLEETKQTDVRTRLKKRFENFKNLLMCYGQTGSGKTYTMSGGAWKENGLIQDFFVKMVND